MKRSIYPHLLEWKSDPERKPLLIRGARQVGKTHLVRTLGSEFEDFIEINLEEDDTFKTVFDGDLAPAQILRRLSLLIDRPITPGKTLLFIDEIQTAPRGITALRYFYEKMPELHVVAAGSLIEFAIEEQGLPVGRVEFLHLYPMSFVEFLWAKNAVILADAITSTTAAPLDSSAHEKALGLLYEYFFVGGMPEAVQCWVETGDVRKTVRKHQTLIQSYREDFLKYASKSQLKYIRLLFDRIPWVLGKKFKFSAISDAIKKRELEPCLNLLLTAGVIHKIMDTSAQGLPLGAQANPDKFKIIFVDMALAQATLGGGGEQWLLDSRNLLINRGNIVEAFVGQELLAYADPHFKADLYYWHKEERTSQAEVDYVTVINQKVVPIEVKSGSSGQLKSLQAFLENHKDSPYGLRFFANSEALEPLIRSFPLYAIAKNVKKEWRLTDPNRRVQSLYCPKRPSSLKLSNL